MKKKFRFKYTTTNGEYKEETVEFEDWTGKATLGGKEVGPKMTITAEEWAEDYLYAVTNKSLNGTFTETF